MPVEFSTAAFRLFHSRARGRYRINDGFDGSSSDKPRARLFDIGLDEPILLGGSTLPAEMIVDWDRFFGDPNAVDSKVELSRIMVSISFFVSFYIRNRQTGTKTRV